ncbi:MAG TPA: glycosyltransferase family 39 protein [Devosia sp.]|nr:glycosyltransferase family 39 protein [Devosia sp.]
MAERRPLAARPVVVAQGAVALLLAIKLYMSIAEPPIGDEAYYWMWGQKLGWSYFDHPPLHAWLLRLMSLIFGWNLFSLRILTWATLAGTFGIFWLWARRLKPEDPQAWFWPTAAIYLAAPLFFLMSSVAFHDHLLIFLCLASAHLFLVFAERWESTGSGYRWLYAGAAVLGLAVLTKYNGVLVGTGIAVFFATRRELRPLFRTPHLYLAALLSLALQAPVIYWNLAEGLASFRFHLAGRWTGAISLRGNHLGEFVLLAVLFISPFLFPAIAAMFRRPLDNAFGERARALALATFTVSTLAMAGLSLLVETYFYWNITGILLLMPLLAGWIFRRWVFLLHCIYGLVFALGCAFNLTVIPIENLRGGLDWTIASTFGWPAVAARVEALKAEHKVGFVAATRYTTAAQLGFALHDPEVTAIASRPDQYDFWFDAAGHRGEDALVVTDSRLGLGEVRGHFGTLTLLETVPYMALGRTVYAAQIYLGIGFDGS